MKSISIRGGPLEPLTIALGLALAVSLLFLGLIYSLWKRASSDLQSARSSRQSLSTRYGQMTEQFMPFVHSYPWDPGRFRFIGSPIDGIQFEEDRVIIVEFKTGSSTLTTRQRRIRDQIKEGRVEFQEIRLDSR